MITDIRARFIVSTIAPAMVSTTKVNRSKNGLQPFLKWAGGKRALIPQISPYLPKTYARYYEPFVGGGALFFHLLPESAIISDHNNDLIECYTQVRDNVEDVIKILLGMTNSEHEYYKVRSVIPSSPSERAARIIYLTRLSFNGIYRVNLKGVFNVPYGNKTRVIPCNEHALRLASTALKQAQILAADFEEALQDATAGDLIYIDPPYTVAHTQNGFLKYNATIFSWNDQIRLARIANDLAHKGCFVMVSNANHTQRCISIAAIFGTLEKSGFYILKEKRGSSLVYGPLWQGENSRTLSRTIKVIKEWFKEIRDRSNGWWESGSAKDGGGLAMNDSIIALLLVLRSVFEQLEVSGKRLVTLDDASLIKDIRPYAISVGEYLGTFTYEKRKVYRSNRGVQGQTARMRDIQQAIRASDPSFNPEGLDKWLEERSAGAVKEAKDIIDRIERELQRVVIDCLKDELGEDERGWWMNGVPERVRLEARDRWEKDKGKRGDPDRYLMFIDYREIILANWLTFQNLLGYGRGSKKDKTQWIHNINDVRKTVMHASAQQYVTPEQLDQLRLYDEWLATQITNMDAVERNSVIGNEDTTNDEEL